MLTLRRLEMEGFGPYAEPQALDFPDEPGVTVVYGENMTGKTSLLNAVRYAFFGRVLGRGSRERRLHHISNRALAAEGKYGFKVRLSFQNDGEEFQLIRSCRPTPGRLIPADDADYEEETKLRCGANILGPGEREAALHRLLPDQISRFFLFDGELLQEYEKLLYQDDDDGRKISDAIEQILGVPILQRSRRYLADLTDEADTMEAKEAAKSKKTEAIGNNLKSATDRKKYHLSELARLQGELDELARQKSDAEGSLKSQRRFLTVIQERDQAEARLKELEGEIETASTALRVHMADAWRTVLRGTVEAARGRASERAAQAVDEIVNQLRRRAIDDGQCSVCEQAVGEATRSVLRRSLPATAETGATKASADLLDLNRFEVRDVASVVTQLAHQLSKARADVARLKDLIRDKDIELKDADRDRLQGDTASLADIMEKIATKKAAHEGHEQKLIEADAAIKTLKDQLAKVASSGLVASQTRSRILRQCTEVCAAAVETYKSNLRLRVEATASDLFRRMTTEKGEYAGLRITDSYGLHLIHNDRAVEEGRSAGAEHVIALALMGALQANAPIRGPIVMDSPFGRLDDGHTENVVATLPTMARQVVLLVHKGEIRQHHVREILGNKLLREYELRKVSSRRTIIEQVR